MNRVLGLFVVLGLAVGGGFLYVSSTTFKAQDVPKSYKVLDDLENKGIYQGEEITLKEVDGEELALSSLKGKVIVLSFWATWCEPCVEEFPSLVKLMDAFPEDVVLVAISHDETEKEVKEFISAFQGFRDNLILTMDENKALSQAFGVDRLPEGFIFDQQGKLRKKIIGIQDWATPNAIAFFKMLTSEPSDSAVN
jgi:thiol-disulfide isomerase/thioredoxin